MRGIWSPMIALVVIVYFTLVSGKALIPQEQQQLQTTGLKDVAQRRDGYDYPVPNDADNSFQDDTHLGDDHGIDDHHKSYDHHGYHHEQDHGYWKKKLIWKPGVKQIWKPAKKEIWKQSQKKIYKPVWIPIKIPAWRKLWKAEWIKVGVKGEKYLGKDHDGWEYTTHDLWKKRLIWKPIWQKYWINDKKLKWEEDFKTIWVKDYKDIWVPGVKHIWRPVVISEWFPSPDHHEHVHEHGWDRSDNVSSGSQQSTKTEPISKQPT